MALGHYENFPVGSLCLPRRLRKSVHVIYRFARYADDVADEGSMADSVRLETLWGLNAELDRIRDGVRPERPMMRELAQVIRQHDLPMAPFYDLLSAFRQDVVKQRYHNFAELMDYCRRSANPVGRLMLCLYGQRDLLSLSQSDALCSALQLLNFLQDVAADWQKQRVYLPQQDLLHFGVSEQQIAQSQCDAAWRSMMLMQLERARHLLQQGAPLRQRLRGRIGIEVGMIILAASRLLDRLQAAGGDVFQHAPKLKARDWVVIFLQALRSR